MYKKMTIEDLYQFKEILKKDDNKHLHTRNNNNNWKGCASFLKDTELIKVFEGRNNGEDDLIMTYTRFIENYTGCIVEE